MLSDLEIKKLIQTLLDLRNKLLWLLKQTPINEEQRLWIEKGKENLKNVNKMLSEFNVKLPS